ncbi:MAG: hypothetical protein IJ555_01270, partial [Ruminococcus sp.]|nr:hypothetical protein [Ruminococcus sp.]
MKKLSLMLAAALSMSLLTACGDSSSSESGAASSQTEESTAASSAESSVQEQEQATYKSIKLMTFGDSITDGFWLSGGYRTFLCNKLEENDLSQYVDFVGKKTGGDCYDNEHEGYTGYSIERIMDSITGSRMGLMNIAEKRLEDNSPDVVTLMVGTNDILSHYELDKAGERLEALVDVVLSYIPEDGMLFLATIPDMDSTAKIPDATDDYDTYIDQDTFTSEYMDQCVSDYNEKVKALVEKKKSEGKNIELADVHSALTKDDLY